MNKKDKDIVKDMDQLERGTHFVNYTRRENPGIDTEPKTVDQKRKEEDEEEGHGDGSNGGKSVDMMIFY